MRKSIVILFFILLHLSSWSQDIHFSQFYFSPLNLSPAQTGFFNGTYRFATNYKSQWRRASGGFPYVTYSASYDMHVLDNVMQASASDIMGFGISAYSDKAGTGHLGSAGLFGSLAYTRDMYGDGSHLISLGIQMGFVQTGFDRSNLRFGDEIAADIATGSGQENFPSTNVTYLDFNAGLLWNYKYSDKAKFYLGLSTFHLSTPKINFLDNAEKNRLSVRTSLMGGAAYTVTRKWDVLPAVLYMWQDASNEVNAGLALRYNAPSFVSIRFGPWYRLWSNSDALILMTGIEYQKLTVGISYDVNISILKSTSYGQGSFEVALIYIIDAKRDIVRDVSCPTF